MGGENEPQATRSTSDGALAMVQRVECGGAGYEYIFCLNVIWPTASSAPSQRLCRHAAWRNLARVQSPH